MSATLFLVDSSAVDSQAMREQEPGTKVCALCGDAIGVVEKGDDPSPLLSWQAYYELQVEGDLEPTLFCEDDISWLTEAAPALLG